MSQADCRELQFHLQVDSSTPVVIYWGNQSPSLQLAQPIKGLFMIGNWRYLIGAILFLGSGCLFLFISPYLGLTKAYLVSLPVFAIGVIIVWRGGRKPPGS